MVFCFFDCLRCNITAEHMHIRDQEEFLGGDFTFHISHFTFHISDFTFQISDFTILAPNFYLHF